MIEYVLDVVLDIFNPKQCYLAVWAQALIEPNKKKVHCLVDSSACELSSAVTDLSITK